MLVNMRYCYLRNILVANSMNLKFTACVIGSGWSSDEDSPSPGKQDKCASQYLPHLRFQITSEDGFSVEADSMDGQY